MPFTGIPSGTPFGPDWQLSALIARHRYGNGVVNDTAGLLTDFYRELQEQLAKGALLQDWQRNQLQPLVTWARTRLEEVVPDARTRLTKALNGLGDAELAAQHGQAEKLRTVMGLPSRARLIQTARFTDIINNADIGGTKLGEWWQRDATNTLGRIKRTVQSGLLQGMNYREVSRLAYDRDPAIRTLDRVNRSSIRAAVSTSMTAVTSAAANLQFAEMADVIDKVRLEAILDARTTLICRALDDQEFAVDDPKRPRPPFHVHCRTAEVPVVDLSALGLPQSALGKRATMEEWVRVQPPRDQDDMLGKQRAEWFRDRKLTLADLVNTDGRVFTLAELAKRLGVPPSAVVVSPPPVKPRATYLADVRRAMEAGIRQHELRASQAEVTVAVQEQALNELTQRIASLDPSDPQRALWQADIPATVKELTARKAALAAVRASRTETVRDALVAEVRATLDADVAAKGTAFRGAMLNPALPPTMRNPGRAELQPVLDHAIAFWDRLFPALPGERTASPPIRIVRERRSGALRGVLYMWRQEKRPKAWVHELAHAFEYLSPKAGEFGRWFRSQRMDSKPIHRLPGFEPGEYFHGGRFTDPYMGKTYDAKVAYFGAVHTEVLSMGLQLLYDQPEQLFASDPEMFELLVDFIRRWRTWSPPTGGP